MQWMLCISTSKRVLRTPFADPNQFFDAKTTLCVLLSPKMYKVTQKITKNPELFPQNYSEKCTKSAVNKLFSHWLFMTSQRKLYLVESCLTVWKRAKITWNTTVETTDSLRGYPIVYFSLNFVIILLTFCFLPKAGRNTQHIAFLIFMSGGAKYKN